MGLSAGIGRIGEADRAYVAVVTDATGRLPLPDDGRAGRHGPQITGEEGHDWALHDRHAEALIGFMLMLQVIFLLGTMLWL